MRGAIFAINSFDGKYKNLQRSLTHFAAISKVDHFKYSNHTSVYKRSGGWSYVRKAHMSFEENR